MDDDSKNKDRIELERDPRIVFYYSRSDRLKRMTQSKKLYDGDFLPKSGVFRILTATKTNRFLLISVFFLAAAVVFLGIVGNRTNQAVVAGVPARVSAFGFEEKVYVTVTFEEKKGFTGEVPVQILVGTYDSSKNLIDSKELSGVYSGAQVQFRTTFTDFEVFQVAAVINAFANVQNMSVQVDRN